MKRKTTQKDLKLLNNLCYPFPHPPNTQTHTRTCSDSFKISRSYHSVQNPPLASHFPQSKSYSLYNSFLYETPLLTIPTLPLSDFIHCCSPGLLSSASGTLPSCRSPDKPGILPTLDLCISICLYLECPGFSCLQSKYLTPIKSLFKCYLYESYLDPVNETASLPPCTPDSPILLYFLFS